MKIRGFLTRGLVLLMLVIVMAGCQDIFTYSVLSSLATSPEDMSAAQLESYAEGALTSGDSDAMAAAYTALVETLDEVDVEDDPDLYLLASDLAIGGSGIPDAVTGALSLVSSVSDDMTTEETEEMAEAIVELIGGIDADILIGSIDIFEEVAALAAADETVEITAAQYTNAAAAMIFVVYSEVNDPADVDPADTRLTQAEDWAAEAGFDMSMLEGMLGGDA